MTNKPEPNTRAGEALKPCERCGGKPMLCEPNYADEGGTMVVCEDCDLAGDSFVLGEYGEGRAQAITAWNTRPLPQPSELVERCEHGVRFPHPCDDCDDEGMKPENLVKQCLEYSDTIAALRTQLAKLQADGDKLAGALERSRQGWSNVLELGLLPVQHQSTALGLQEAATQALTERKDRA